MPQKFSSISKGELKKFDGRNARIVTRVSGIEATGQIWVCGEMVILLTEVSGHETGLEEDLDRADMIKHEFVDAFDLYYEDDIDETVRTNLVKEIEIF